jgi:hypothetical protein
LRAGARETRREEISTLHLFLPRLKKDTSEPPPHTRYDDLRQRLGELKADRQVLATKAQEAREKAVLALADGEAVPADDGGSSVTLEQLDDAIAEVRRRLADPAVKSEHITAWRSYIQRENDILAQQREPFDLMVKEAQKKFDEVKQEARNFDYRAQIRREALERIEQSLWSLQEDPRSTAAADELPPLSMNASRVEELLQHLRDERHRTLLLGEDPDMAEAYERFEGERTALRHWADRAKLSRRTNGTTPTPPAFAAFYSTERLREITGVNLLP